MLRRQVLCEGAQSKPGLLLNSNNNAIAPPLDSAPNGSLGTNSSETNSQFHQNNEKVMERQHRGSLRDLPPHIIAQIQDFRSQNQASNEVRDQPKNDFNIRNLQANEDLHAQVENGVQSVRKRISSLARAQSAFT